MTMLEVFFHEFFSFNYQLFFFLPFFCCDVKWRKWGPARYLGLVLLCCLPCSIYYAVTGNVFFNQWIFNFGGWYSTYYLLVVFVAIIILLLSCEMKFKAAVFFTTGAYIVQHLAMNCYLLLAVFFNVSGQNLTYRILCFFLLMVIMVTFQFQIRPHLRKDMQEINIESTTVVCFLFLTIIFINVLTSWIYYQEGGDLSGHIGYNYYGGLSSILLLILQFGMVDLTEAVRDKQAMNDLIRKAEKQYIQSKENIEALNAKYHDFKYRILELLTSKQNEEGSAYLNETLQLIENYQDTFQTGNEAMNILLSEKSALCKKENILLTCFIDGAALSFIKPADIYLLFGNALDNAIESLVGTQGEIQKTIDVSVTKKSDFIVVVIENTCRNDVEFVKGMPVTSKADKSSHGFGTKTIRYIVEKYSGNLVMDCTDHIFTVRCLIPAPKS